MLVSHGLHDTAGETAELQLISNSWMRPGQSGPGAEQHNNQNSLQSSSEVWQSHIVYWTSQARCQQDYNVGVSGAFVCDGSQCDRNHWYAITDLITGASLITHQQGKVFLAMFTSTLSYPLDLVLLKSYKLLSHNLPLPGPHQPWYSSHFRSEWIVWCDAMLI